MRVVVYLALLLFLVVTYCNATDYPFRNVSLLFSERVKDLVDRLTLDELVGQMAHGGAVKNGPAPPIARLGINPYQWGTECLSGDVRAGAATSFPMPIGMAASFDYDLIYNVSKAVGQEVRAKNNNATAHDDYSFHTGLSCWSPVINIMRDPRWGRNQETFGEDPWLSGYLADAFVKGLQGNDSRYVQVNAGCKHFDVHGGPENIPVSRFSFDAKVSERDWRMTFLPQFKSCVEAGSWSLMCSYNSINGVPACANSKLLTDILRNEWNFKGYVVSDNEALVNIVKYHNYTSSLLNASALAAKAGTCLEDANSEEKTGNVFANLGDAVEKGMISEDVLKDAVSRLFMVRMRLGEFDPPDRNPYKKYKTDIIQSKQHKELALKAALESAVLLKLNGWGTSDRFKGPKFAHLTCVVGPFIDNPELYFGDYAPDEALSETMTVLAGLKKHIVSDKITSAEGCLDGPACKNYNKSAIVEACQGADQVVITVGTSILFESEGHDRSDLNLPGYQHQLIMDATNIAPVADTSVVIFSAGPVNVTWAADNDAVDQIIAAFFPGQATGEAIGLMFYASSPAGRLPFTWPRFMSQVPDMTDYTMKGRTYRYFTDEPLFPFGFGLAHSHFGYKNMTVTPMKINAGESVNVSVFVSPVFQLKDYIDEVTQVYLKWDDSVNEAPIRQLVGASRNTFRKYDTIKVEFEITEKHMQVWRDGKWVVPSGTMTVSVGGQQPDQTVKLRSNVLVGTITIA